MRGFAVAVLAVVMLGSIFVLPQRVEAAPPQPMTLYGIAQDASGQPLPLGTRITTFVDGADYSNGTSVYSNLPNPWNYDVDTFGNWITGIDSDTTNVQEGAMFGDPVMLVAGDMTTIGLVFRGSPIWVNGDNRNITPLRVATAQPGLLKVRSITVNPSDGLTDYLYLCNPASNPLIDSGKYYLQKDSVGSPLGPRFPAAANLPSQMIPPGGRMYVDLSSATWFTATGDAVKLVYDNSVFPNDAFGGIDLIVDRVEFNATGGGTLDAPNMEPINTIMTDAGMPTGVAREIRRIPLFPGDDCGQDTNDNEVDFADMPETPRPGPNTPPTVTVTAPVATDDWTGGSTHTVSWTTGDAEDLVLTSNVTGSWDGGSYPYVIVPNRLDPKGPNSASWTLPCALGPGFDTPAARVRAIVNDSGAQSALGASAAFKIDCTAPTVTQTPSGGATGVSTTTPLILTFSEPMNAAATNAAVSLCLMPGCSPADILNHTDALWSGGNTMLTIWPSSSLVPDQDYRSTVACSALDASAPGNPLAACPRTFTFRTATGGIPLFTLSYPKTVNVDWTGGSTHPINWNQTYSADTSARLTAVLSYTATGGAPWTTIVTVTGDQLAKTHSWAVPVLPSDTALALVRVCDIGNGTNCDQSVVLFRIDSTPPTLSMDPANGETNVAVGQSFFVTFSEAMNQASVQTAFNVNPNPGITSSDFTWNANELTVTHPNFATCVSPIVTFSTAARDASDPGNPIAAFSSTFSTPCAPTVSVTRPTTTDVWTCGSTHNVVVAFGDSDSTLVIWVNVSTDGTSFLPAPNFMPASYPTPTTQLSIGIPTISPPGDSTNALVRVTAQDPTRLNGEGTSAQFKIDCTPPTVTTTNPANGATNIPVGQSFVIVFSEAMNTAATNTAISLTPTGGTLTPAWAPNNTMVTVAHSAALQADTDYTLTIGTLAKDASDPGNAMAAAKTVSFHTAVGLVANAGGPYTGAAGTAVSLDGRASTPSSAITGYSWEIKKGGAHVAYANATTAQTTYTFAADGTYEVILTVFDASGNSDSASTTATISVKQLGFLDQYWWVLLILLAAILAAILFLVMGRRRKKDDEPEKDEKAPPKPAKSSTPPKSPPKGGSPPRAAPAAAAAAAAAPASGSGSPNTMACPSCGTIVDVTDKECFMCGTALK